MGMCKVNVLVACLVSGFAAFSNSAVILNDSTSAEQKSVVQKTFNNTKLITLQTTELIKANTFRLNVTDIFGNMSASNGGGTHTFYGLDNSSDIRLSLDYGISSNLMLGIGRSKQHELVDGYIKYQLLQQTTDNKTPVSIALYGDASYNTQRGSDFYNSVAETSHLTHKSVHRLSYISQLIIARKCGSRCSILLVPGFQHRNFVVATINQNNNAEEGNNLFSLGTGLRLKLNEHISFIADYTYIFSKYRTNNLINPYYNPLSLGLEIATTKHIFQFSFTNVSGIIENNYLPNSNDSWLKGGVKFTMNISREFNCKKSSN